MDHRALQWTNTGHEWGQNPRGRAPTPQMQPQMQLQQQRLAANQGMALSPSPGNMLFPANGHEFIDPVQINNLFLDDERALDDWVEAPDGTSMHVLENPVRAALLKNNI